MTLASLGKSIRYHRLARSLTQRELAHRAGTSTKWVERLEGSHGRVNPKAATLIAIASALGVGLADLLRQSPPNPVRPKPLRHSQRRLIELVEQMDAGRSGALLKIAEYMLSKVGESK